MVLLARPLRPNRWLCDPPPDSSWKGRKSEGQAPDVVYGLYTIGGPFGSTTVIVGGGSEIKIAATVFPYAMNTNKTIGLSLRPNAVQILSLVSNQSNVVSMFDDEDGFKTETAPAANENYSSPELETAADF